MTRQVHPIARPRILGLLAVAIAVASTSARGQGTPTLSTVLDGAGMFSDEAIRQAKSELAASERAHGVTVTVQTVESLRGQTIDEVAVRRAEQLGHKGVFVLIAKQDRKAEALASPRALFEELGKDRLNEIRDAFTAEFRRNRVDEGLNKGVQAAGKVLAAVRPASTARRPEPGGFLPSSTSPHEATPSGSSAGGSPLLLRQQVRLTLAGARKAIEGAEAKAGQQGWKMNIAVVDDGGHLLAFGRMDGARPASVATATTKAVTAATYRQPTGPLVGAAPGSGPDVLLSLSLQNAAAASGGKITTLPGGIPIVVDGQVIGAVGVGGGTGEQDAEVARAGVAAFLEGLQAKPKDPEPKAEEPKAKPKDPEPKVKDPEVAPATKPVEADTNPKP